MVGYSEPIAYSVTGEVPRKRGSNTADSSNFTEWMIVDLVVGPRLSPQAFVQRERIVIYREEIGADIRDIIGVIECDVRGDNTSGVFRGVRRVLLTTMRLPVSKTLFMFSGISGPLVESTNGVWASYLTILYEGVSRGPRSF
jgi:hypothetical protein